MGDRVLVVDDEPQILRALSINLRARGYDVDLAPSGEEALRQAADHHPDVVILDLGLPGISGIEVIQALDAVGTPGPGTPKEKVGMISVTIAEE